MAPAGHSRVMVCRKSILGKARDRGWGVWEGDVVDGYERQGMVDASGTKAAIGDGRGVVADGKETMVVVVDGAAVVGRGVCHCSSTCHRGKQQHRWWQKLETSVVAVSYWTCR
jgi:hypothetical protein